MLNMSGGSLLNKGLLYEAEIEYLESSGTQYIDTTVKFNGAMNIKCVFQNTDATTTPRDRRFLGGADSWQGNGVSFAENLLMFFNQVAYFSFYNNTGVHTMTLIDRVLTIDMGYVRTLSANSNTAETSIALFAEHRPYGYSDYLTGRIKTFSVGYNSDANDVIDLIPVRIGTTGYMYDKVSGQLFGNAGTGDFILGPDK